MKTKAIRLGTALAVVAVLLALAGCGNPSQKVVPALKGMRLDVAENTLDSVGVGYQTIGGGAFGIVIRSHWTVCSQSPRPGSIASSVTLYVERTCPREAAGVVPDVQWDSLDNAREELEADGFQVEAETLDGDAILVEANWTVCDQTPEPGYRGRTVVLDVAHDCWDY
jgi:beta-lactam-binding protein with PASTA domain